MPRLALVLASLEAADCAVRFHLVGELGQIRRRTLRSGDFAFFLDFRPYGRVWSHRGIQITDEITASRLIEQIRGEVADGRGLEEVLSEYLPARGKTNLVPSRLHAGSRCAGARRRAERSR